MFIYHVLHAICHIHIPYTILYTVYYIPYWEPDSFLWFFGPYGRLLQIPVIPVLARALATAASVPSNARAAIPEGATSKGGAGLLLS